MRNQSIICELYYEQAHPTPPRTIAWRWSAERELAIFKQRQPQSSQSGSSTVK
jgi:hypothetical protein